jgi:hypothetical protein
LKLGWKFVQLYGFGRQQFVFFLLAVGDVEALGSIVEDDDGRNDDGETVIEHNFRIINCLIFILLALTLHANYAKGKLIRFYYYISLIDPSLL